MRCASLLKFLLALSLLFSAGPVLAEPDLPPLTGRVVDQAALLDETQKAALTAKLEAVEAESSNQIVVVTVSDLQGYDIAQFGLALGRTWGIGQQDKDNGAILLVAPNERKVRIEVGRGLEGFLTDAASHTIIRKEILPAFRNGDFPGGITRGVDAMLGAIDGSYDAAAIERRDSKLDGFIPLIFIGIVAISEFLKRKVSSGIAGGVAFSGVVGMIVSMATSNVFYGVLAAIGAFAVIQLLGSGGGGPGSSSGRRRDRHGSGYIGGGSFGGGGGFSGGGGGFGGGGASGGW